MSPNITQKLRLTLEYVDPFQVRVTFSTLGEIERLRFERKCENTCINPDNFDIYIEERQGGNSIGKTDRYFSIKSDRCLRDTVFRGERYRFTPSYKRLRSVPDVLKLYRPTDQDIDDLLEEFREPLVPKAPKARKAPKAPKAPKAQKAQKVVEFCKSDELKEEIEVDCGVDMITNHYDGRSTRPLCRHQYNSKNSQYGIPCSQHVPECMCPIHRAGSLWRKLTGAVRVDRNNKMMKNDTEYMKHVIGMGLDEYHNYLVGDFQKNFIEILPYEMLIKNFEELRAEKFVIDEIFPRCEGKHLVDTRDIAIFLAKVFNYRNTQLLLHNNVEARKHGVDTKQFKMLINSSKNGSVCPGAENKFNQIEPSEEAISYMLEFVNRFREKLPKLEI